MRADAAFRFRRSPDRTWSLSECSGAVEEATGWDAAAFLDKTVTLPQLLHEEDRPPFEALLADPAAAPDAMLIRLRHKTGAVRCFRLRCTAGNAGNAPELHLILHDVKRLPRTLPPVTDNMVLSAMMDNSDILICFVDKNHIWRGASRSFTPFCPFAERWTDLIGKTAYELFPEKLADSCYRLENEILAGGSAAREVMETEIADGERVWIDARKYPIRDAAGTVIGVCGIAKEITAEVNATNALEKTVQKLKETNRMARLGHWELDFGKNRLTWSEEIHTIFGIERKAAIHSFKSYLRAVHPEDRKKVDAAYKKALRDHNLYDITHRLVMKDGGIKHVHIQGTTQFDKDGTPLRAAGTIQDVTEQHRYLTQLKRFETRFHTLFENLPNISVQGYDAKRRIIYWNQASEKLYGYSAEEAMGRTLEELIIPPFMREGVVRGVTAWMNEGTPIPASELTLMRKDGSEIHVFSSHVMLTNSKNEPEMYCIDVDLTGLKEAEAGLKREHTLFKTLIQTLPDPVWLKDTDGVYLACNRRFEDFCGLHESELTGKTDYDIADRESAELFRANDRKAIENNAPETNEEWSRFASDGHRALLETTKVPMYDGDGTLIGVLAVGRDITERYRMETEIRQKSENFRSIFDSVHEAIYIQKPDGTFLAVNRGAAAMYGYSAEWFIGKTPLDVAAEGKNDLEAIPKLLQKAVEGEPQVFEFWGRRADGTVFPKEVHVSRGSWDGQTVIIAAAIDITERKKHQDTLEHLAHYDLLTGLPNRFLVTERLILSMAQTRRNGSILAVAYLDLDGFKEINDTYGHETGDRLLVILSQRVSAILRGSDTFGRIGGDEFVILLFGLESREKITAVIRKILKVIAEPVRHDEYLLKVSVSIGVTFYPQEDIIDADQLLRQADQSMFMAKQQGKNRFHLFDTESDRIIRQHHTMVRELEAGIAHGEFRLYFQPEVDMRSNEMLRCEALLRWEHPHKGMLSPETFLHHISGESAIIPIGKWVLENAVAQIGRWKAEGLHIPLSVNIDGAQLHDPGFLGDLRALVKASPFLEPGDLQLEILETTALDNIADVTAIILACKKLGIDFALDDFGTGYSSLAYLRKLPVTVIKIDKSFILDMLHDPDDLLIIEGIIGLSKAFGLELIAEGVESSAFAEKLLALGCRMGQGYIFGKPMTAGDLAEWVRKNGRRRAR